MAEKCSVGKPLSTSGLITIAGAFVGAMFLAQYMGAPAGAAVGTLVTLYVVRKM